ncbi:MAG: hypothetical protein IPG81_19595 [Sandaracinaceae bacterium]|nr:hypothetical protein [Sandaracinaceae bacterium]
MPTEAGGVAGDLYITVEGFESPTGLAVLARRPDPRAALLAVGAVALLFASPGLGCGSQCNGSACRYALEDRTDP